MVTLRKISRKDTANIVRWRNNPSVLKMFIDQREITEQDHLTWLKNKVETHEVEQFIIEFDCMDVGSVFLRDIDKATKTAEFGIFIGEESCRGKGVGTLAIKSILAYGFEELKLDRIFLRVLKENEIAINAYKKQGFKTTEKEEIVNIKGNRKIVIFMDVWNRYEKK